MKMVKRFLALVLSLAMLCSSGLAEAVSAAPALPGQLTLEDIQALNGGEANAFLENDKLYFLDGTCTAEPVKTMDGAARIVDAMLGLLGGDETTHFEPLRTLNDASGNA